MGIFTPRVMRLLSDTLTGTPVREIDALFEDRGVALGSPRHARTTRASGASGCADTSRASTWTTPPELSV